MKYIIFNARDTKGHEWQHDFALMDKYNGTYETRAEAEKALIISKEETKKANSHISTHNRLVFGLTRNEDDSKYELITLEKL